MPLTMAKQGDVCIIKRITGKDEQRLFLERLGFVVGEKVTVISEMSGNIIVNIKETRVAVSKSAANKILV
jgi:ferrous iron transport protein A